MWVYPLKNSGGIVAAAVRRNVRRRTLDADLKKVEDLYDRGILNLKEYGDYRELVIGTHESYVTALAKLGDCNYGALREEFVSCRLYGHNWPNAEWRYVGISVGPGYGLTDKNQCSSCGTVTFRYRNLSNFRSNGSAYEYPDGYLLEGLSESLTKADVRALEFYYELPDVLKQIKIKK